jgi:hypothetical protein
VNTAMQIAAAITAYSRMHMSQFIVDENVFYTDTDSIYTKEPLENHLIGKELGQMKLEAKIIKGVFIAPKTYYYIHYNLEKKKIEKIIKFKGFN